MTSRRATIVLFANLLVVAFAIYVALGLLFAIAFVTVGVQRIDPGAQGGSILFRLLILPGTAAFWPLLLRRWLMSGSAPAERTAHRVASGERASRGQA